MNNRYVQIVLTCLIAGTITYALKMNKAQQPSTTNQINTLSDMAQSSASGSVTIEPEIGEKDLKYKHWSGTYSPTEISLTVNGKKIEIDNTNSFTVPVDKDSTITTCCEYKFIKGYEGKKTYQWKVQPGKKIKVTFDWKSDQKIQLEGAESSVEK